jgi:hypothetical protein
MKSMFFVLVLSAISMVAFAQKALKNAAANPHSAWTALLKKYVKAGNVDYKGIKADADFEAYLKSLRAGAPAANASREVSMAYWINVYNAFTIKLIADNYPVKSIKDINKGEPWKKKWIVIGAATYSLDQIENEILRPKYKDGRVHFAINCAARSCPPLRSEAFTAAQLDAQLEEQTTNFVNSSATVVSGSSVKLSSIFDWFKGDFGDVATFLRKYSRTKIGDKPTISYQTYDWTLNGK